MSYSEAEAAMVRALAAIAEAISDSRIHNTMTIAEWCREASGD